MGILIAIGIFLFVLILIIFNIKKDKYITIKQHLEKESEELKQKNKELQEVYDAMNHNLEIVKKAQTESIIINDRLQKENANLTQSNVALQNRNSEYARQIDAMITDGKKTAKKTVDDYIEQYRNNRLQEENKKLEEFLLSNNQMKDVATGELEQLKKEIEDYTKKREAIIEAQKRELELQDAQEFHKIQLVAAAIEDIKYINTILNKLSKPDIVAKVVWEAYLQTPTKEMLNRVVGKEKKSGIYRIANIKTQQCYIGQGVDVAKRLAEHIKGTLGIQSIADQRIHHVMAEEGLQNWTFELLEECEKGNLNNREKFYIMYYRSNEFGYNKTIGG